MSQPPHRLPGRVPGIRIAIWILLVAGFGASWFHFTQARPVGIGRAGPPVLLQRFDRVWKEGPVLLLGLGDSVTAGFGARKGWSYFDRLSARPPGDTNDPMIPDLRRVFPQLEVRNLSVSGSTSLDHAQRQLARIPPVGSNVFGVVVLTTGGNDLIHHYGRLPPKEGAMYGATREQARPWIARFESRLGDMLNRIRASFPGGCHIFLANIYDPTDGSGDLEAAGLGLPPWPDAASIHGEYNAVIRRVADRREDTTLVDVHAAFLGHGIHCTQPWHPSYRTEDPHYWYYDNLEDPNERGYDAIRRLFLLEMARHLPAHASSAPPPPPGITSARIPIAICSTAPGNRR